MKITKIWAVIFVCVALFGCSRERTPEEILEESIEVDVKNVLGDKWVNINKDLLRSISACSNNSVRIKLFQKWGDGVLAVKMPMQTNDYLALCRICNRVEERILKEVSWGLIDECEGSKEMAFEMRFKLIDWQKKRMDELLAVAGKVAKDGYHDRMWRHCYTALFLSYKSNICMMEWKWFPHDLKVRKTPQEEKDRIQRRIENYLGRKMKKSEEVDWEWETEIYKKVRKEELP